MMMIAHLVLLQAKDAVELPPNYHGLPFLLVQAGVALPALSITSCFLLPQPPASATEAKAGEGEEGADAGGEAADDGGEPQLPPRPPADVATGESGRRYRVSLYRIVPVEDEEPAEDGTTPEPQLESCELAIPPSPESEDAAAGAGGKEGEEEEQGGGKEAGDGGAEGEEAEPVVPPNVRIPHMDGTCVNGGALVERGSLILPADLEAGEYVLVATDVTVRRPGHNSVLLWRGGCWRVLTCSCVHVWVSVDCSQPTISYGRRLQRGELPLNVLPAPEE